VRTREAAHVHFIDDAFRKLAADVPVTLPVKRLVHHHAFWRANNPIVSRQKIPGQRACVRINQACLAVKTLTAGGIVGSVGLEVIQLPGAQPRHEHAPDVSPAISIGRELDHPGRVAVRDPVIQ
jgi:hypothetical protein